MFVKLGNPLMLDFFLDEEETANTVDLMGNSKPNQTETPKPAAPVANNDVSPSMNALKSLISPELVKSNFLSLKSFMN